MATTRKIVESFEVILKTEEDSELAFENILLDKTFKEYQAHVGGKNVALTILEKGDTIVGIVETTRTHNIPPKNHPKKRTIKAIDLEPGEGLAYGNIFLYEKKRKILLYEVNKFGCYIDHFGEMLEFIIRENAGWAETFGVDFKTILKPDEYKRMKKMDYYKSIEIQFANPAKVQKDYEYENDSLAKAISLGKELHSDKFLCKFEVKSKRQGGAGLSNTTIRDIITKAKGLLQTETGSKNIKKLTVYGYSKDEEGGERLEPIDLLADRYLKHIHLTEPAQNTDLLEGQRKQQIKKLYKECLSDFKEIFGA